MKKSITQQYKETLTYLYSQLPMFQRVGNTAFKKDLTNILALCQHLNQPQQQFPSIHIAGTNGKGSTTHMIGAILQASGLKVGLYTSPHYKDFRERIKINGKLISKRSIIDFVQTHRELFKEIQPSFFEITVALAFDYFAKQKVDIAIIETGLGGRLDSTNIIQPLLSVITNISYDHQQFLGETLVEIAGEKAGIIKKNTPVIIGETQSEVQSVFIEKAKLMQAPISFADKQVQVEEKAIENQHSIYNIKSNIFSLENASVNIQGSYQQKNIKTAIQTITELNKLQQFPFIPKNTIMAGLKDLKKRTYFIGRWQQLAINPMIICDSGHNEAGIQQILIQLENINYQQLHFVLGVVRDKSIEKTLKMLPKNAQYYFVKAAIPRGLEAKVLKEKAKQFGLKGRVYSSVKNGLKAAKRKAAAADLIFIGGSTFVVAEVV
jgi:dihydrofolate synthase/folylpolyglutamate synthase